MSGGNLPGHYFKGALSSLRQFLATESSLKVMKNAFDSTLKVFSSSRYLNFCLGILVIGKNDPIKMVRLLSKFMKSQPEKQTTAIHILSNISRSKCNELMKFGQLIEYNMRNIFFEKSYTKCSEELILRLFSKKSELSISMDQ